MNVNEIKKSLNNQEYDFLKTNPRLGNNIILLGLGGSHAYGTNVEGSDIDIRGIALNSKEEILLNKDFEQVVDTNTDTTIYSFSKIVKLLAEANPNTLEIIFQKPEHYIVLNEIGKLLVENRHLFLSKKCYYTFGGYARQQLRRLDNKSMRSLSQSEQEIHILIIPGGNSRLLVSEMEARFFIYKQINFLKYHIYYIKKRNICYE